MIKNIATSIGLWCSLIIAGCGESGPQMAAVEGTVTQGGKPLPKIMVEFWPTSSGPRSLGISDDQGRFKMTSDDGKKEGAAVGPHKVVLKDIGIIDENAPLGRAAENIDITRGRKPRIAAKYGNPETTSISETVKEGTNDIKIEADSR